MDIVNATFSQRIFMFSVIQHSLIDGIITARSFGANENFNISAIVVFQSFTQPTSIQCHTINSLTRRSNNMARKSLYNMAGLFKCS